MWKNAEHKKYTETLNVNHLTWRKNNKENTIECKKNPVYVVIEQEVYLVRWLSR